MSPPTASNNGDRTSGTTPKHSVRVAGIVVRGDDRILVIRRDDNGHWEAPGGV
ncbi:NUDIX hydrolase, partial [Mycobacterium timonense]|uniref:NUDIX hydrolase n=1 Tax=Mycobacterium timonense TaxID=701043 RepID=UPI003B8473AB